MTLPSAKPKQEPHLVSLTEKLEAAKRDLDKWTKVAALPELSPKAKEFATNAARSAAAEMKLRQIALAREKLEQAKADHRKWSKVAALPGLSPEAATFAANAARSYAALVVLAQKALDYLTAPPKANSAPNPQACEPLAKLIEARQTNKARRAETIRQLLIGGSPK